MGNGFRSRPITKYSSHPNELSNIIVIAFLGGVSQRRRSNRDIKYDLKEL